MTNNDDEEEGHFSFMRKKKIEANYANKDINHLE